MFLADLTFLWLINNCLKKLSELIFAQAMSTIVTNRVLSWFDFFSVITTVWAKMWENSYLREFCAQVSQSVFLADLTVLRIITTVWEKNFTKLISPLVFCTSLPNRVVSWFDRFTSYYNCMKKNGQKTHLCAISVHKCPKSCSLLIWPFYGLIQLYERKWHKFPNSTICVHKCHKSCS